VTAVGDAGPIPAGPPDLAELVVELERRRAAALAMGGPERVRRQHESGRLTVRERIDRLVDADSFYELGLLALPELRTATPAPADAIVTGWARVDGRPVAVVGVDATVLAGTTAPVNMRKQGRLEEYAGSRGVPVIALSDADGGRIPDVMGWRFSGLPFDFATFVQPPAGLPPVPRVTAVLGPSFGDAALHAAAAHLVVMTRSASLALSGPPVVAAAVGEELTAGDLGGPAVALENGYAHLAVDDEDSVFAAVRSFLAYLPSNGSFSPPVAAARPPARDPEDLLRIVPTNPKRAYDMAAVIESVVDAGSMFPWAARMGRSLLTVLARIDGRTVGVVANQPLQRAGVLDERALAKELAFVDLCDSFNVPLVFLHDVPGLMIGSAAERGGILLAYERIVARLSRVRVPKIGVIVRKSYGGGNFAMGGRPTHPDLLVSWPGAQLGFMAPETGVRTVHRRRLERTREAEGEAGEQALLAELTGHWSHESEPWEAAAHGYLDDVIDPRLTREVVRTGIEFGWGSRRPPSQPGG